MKFGLTEEEFSILNSAVIQPLKEKNCTVWIFGSRARGDFKNFSDIDLLYAAPPLSKLTPGFYGLLKEAADRSRLNYKVDLVNVEDLAQSYRESVLKDRILL